MQIFKNEIKFIKRKKKLFQHAALKIEKLRLRRNNVSPRKNYLVYLKHKISNVLSYQLTYEEERALSYGLDLHISSKADPNLIYTEFESYFQSIKQKITNVPKT